MLVRPGRLPKLIGRVVRSGPGAMTKAHSCLETSGGTEMKQPPTRLGRGLLVLLVYQTVGVLGRSLPLTNTFAVPLAFTSPDSIAP
jgi:hypothetical protein